MGQGNTTEVGDRLHIWAIPAAMSELGYKTMRGRLPSDVYLYPKDVELLECVFAQVIPEHDTHPDELAVLLVRLSRTASEMSAKCWRRV